MVSWKEYVLEYGCTGTVGIVDDGLEEGCPQEECCPCQDLAEGLGIHGARLLPILGAH